MNLKPTRKIETAQDYNDYVSDMYESFLEELKDEDWATRPVNEDDMMDEGIEYIWRSRAIRLVEDFKSRLYKLGEKLFPGEDIQVYESNWYIDQ